MRIFIEGKKIELKKVNPSFSLGLMFSRKEKAKALLFEFKSSTRLAITSIFVFFDFLAIWLDSDGKVIEKQVVKPWKFSVKPKKDFVKLIEIPINRRYSGVLKSLVEDTKSL